MRTHSWRLCSGRCGSFLKRRDTDFSEVLHTWQSGLPWRQRKATPLALWMGSKSCRARPSTSSNHTPPHQVEHCAQLRDCQEARSESRRVNRVRRPGSRHCPPDSAFAASAVRSQSHPTANPSDSDSRRGATTPTTTSSHST